MPKLSHGKTLITREAGIEQGDLPPIEDGRLDPRSWFAHPERRFEIEIGSGKGTFLVQQAVLDVETNFLGIEWSGPFYRYAADRVRRHGMHQVKLLHGHAVEFLHHWCADAIAAVVHVYFSDPWPKARHHKRRVIQDASLRDMHRVLAPGGEVRLVTDHDDLWTWYEEHAERNAALFERRDFRPPTSARPGELVGTNYERKFAVEGRTMRGMTLVRREGDA